MRSILRTPQMGVYAITNTTTGDRYVGRAVDLHRRWKQHRAALGRGAHWNQRLQSAWTREGAAGFTFRVLDYVDDRDDLPAAEQQWTRALRPAYNISPSRTTAQDAREAERHRQGPWSVQTVGRFWSKVRKSEGCWEWTGARSHGYGNFFLYKDPYTRRLVHMRAHRFSYTLAHGFIPPAALLLHQCDNRGCVRPDHLVAGDSVANGADARSRGRFRPRRGEASPHHKLTEDDVREIRRRYGAGESIKTLTVDYGISQGCMSNVVHGVAWAHVEGAHPVMPGKRVIRHPRAPRMAPPWYCGENAPWAKLSAAQVREIRERYAAGGTSYACLARDYGVHLMTISGIVRHKQWRHVD